MQTQLRVVIGDKHDALRMSLALFFAVHKDMLLVGEAEDGLELVRIAAERAPDVILMELNLPLLSSPATIMHIKQANPAIAIILLTSEIDPIQIQAALAAGAARYFYKDVSTENLADAIRTVGRAAG